MFSVETAVTRRSRIRLTSLSCLVLVSLCVGRSSAAECYGAGLSLTAIYTHQNESVRGEVGFNTSFALLIQENGTLGLSYPWIDANEFGSELNFTARQREPLRNLSVVTNSSQVGVHYLCNLTTLNCTVSCSFGSGEETGLGADANRSAGGFCSEGSDLESLKESPNITNRWDRLCLEVMEAQTDESSSIRFELQDGNETVTCDYNTTVPVRYNITLWGGGLNTTTVSCRQDLNRTVICHVTANVTGLQNVSDVLCTVLSSSWPTRFAKRLFEEEDDFYIYEYPEEGEGEGEYQARLGSERPEGPAPDSGGPIVIIAVVACVGLLAVSVGMILRHRGSARHSGSRRVVYRPQFRPSYHPAV